MKSNKPEYQIKLSYPKEYEYSVRLTPDEMRGEGLNKALRIIRQKLGERLIMITEENPNKFYHLEFRHKIFHGLNPRRPTLHGVISIYTIEDIQ
jgi:hypothetical protein